MKLFLKLCKQLKCMFKLMSNTDFVRISGCSLPNKALQQYKKNKIKKALHQTCVGNEFLNLEQLWDPPLNEK